MDSIGYKCVLCNCMCRDKSNVMELFSEEAIKEQIKEKILCALAIGISDPMNIKIYVCRSCCLTVDFISNFASSSRINFGKYIENLPDLPENEELKIYYKSLLQLPFIDLFYKYKEDIKGMYDEFMRRLKDNVGHNNHNSIADGIIVGNNIPDGDETPESSSLNVPITNEPNIVTDGTIVKNNIPVGDGTPESSSVTVPFTNERNIGTNNINK